MTGQSTRPPTTLGKAPSMPATTTRASALPSRRQLVQEPVQARDAHVGHQRDLAVPGLGRDPRLLGDGEVARPRRDDDDPAELGLVRRRPGDPEGAAELVVLSLGEDRLEVGGGRGVDPGRPAPPARARSGS